MSKVATKRSNQDKALFDGESPKKKLAKRDEEASVQEEKTSDQDNSYPDGSSSTKNAEKKTLKNNRKKAECAEFELVQRAKKAWEIARKEKNPDVERILSIVHGNILKICYSHEISRIIQWMVKFGSEEVQNKIWEEIKSCILNIMQQKFSVHLVNSMLENGSKSLKSSIVACVLGNTVKLLSHHVSSKVVGKIYQKYATKNEQVQMKNEFYYHRHQVQGQHQEDNSSVKTAENMRCLKENLLKLLNKQLVSTGLFHTVLLEFLNSCSAADKEEILAMSRPLVLQLLDSESGSQVAMQCFWFGSIKERKNMMKNCKDSVTSIATHEHSYLILVSMIDSVDDIVLFNKLILSQIIIDIEDILRSDYGRKILMYLLKNRNQRNCCTKVAQLLRQGDGNKNSKKSMEDRRKEILNCIKKPLLISIAKNISMWLEFNAVLVPLLAVFQVSEPCNEKTAAFMVLANSLCDPKVMLTEKDGTRNSLIESSAMHFTVKHLIKETDFEYKDDSSLFCNTFGDVILKTGAVERFLKCNRGAYTLLFILEHPKFLFKDALTEIVRAKGVDMIISKLSGAKILIEKCQ